MARATAETVRAVITTDATANLDQFIDTANALVNHVDNQDSLNLLTDELLTQIEIYLAAHFYALRDPQYQSKATGRASAVFQGQTGKGLQGTWWGQQALILDITGVLSTISEGAKPVLGLSWLGLPEDSRSNWWDR